MSTRATPLLRRLSAVHDAHALRRAVAIGLRAAAALTVAVALLVLLGLVLPVSPATARARTIVLGLASLVTAFWAVRRVRRASVSFDGFLEQVEQAFPPLRSWLRNALDFETRPPAGTSAELVGALHEEAARRFDGTPVDTLRPKLAPGQPALLAGAALAAVLVALGISPSGTRLARVRHRAVEVRRRRRLVRGPHLPREPDACAEGAHGHPGRRRSRSGGRARLTEPLPVPVRVQIGRASCRERV